MSESGPRRVLMTTDAVGGVWTYALDLAQGLGRYGVGVELAIVGPAPAPEQRAEAQRIDGLVIHETGLPLEWTAAFEADVIAAGDALATLANQLAVDLVHLNNPSFLARGRFRQPVVVACHSCIATWWGAVRGAESLPADLGFAWRARLTGLGYARADALVAPTHAFALATQRCYGLARTPLVVPNGRAAPEEPVRDVIGTDSVISAGRLWDEGKNVATLDRVAARLSAPVRAAGDLVGANGARATVQHIEALGHLSKQALRARFAERPIYVSLALYEPFGLAALEAAQAGCALVLSDIPTLRELWADAALFTPARDDAAAAVAIQSLLDNPAQRFGLGEAARARAAVYSLERCAAGVDAIHRHVLKHRRQLELTA